MARRRHHKAEGLGPEATKVINDGLAAGARYEDIAEKLFELHGEQISTAAIGRYYQAKWKPQQDAARQATLLAREMVDWAGGLGPQEVRDAIAMRTAQQLIPMIEALAQEKPERAAEFYSSLEQRRIAEQRLNQRNAELELRQRKLEQEKKLAEAKLTAIVQKLESATKKETTKKAKTPAELERLLQDLYGIARPPEKTS